MCLDCLDTFFILFFVGEFSFLLWFFTLKVLYLFCRFLQDACNTKPHVHLDKRPRGRPGPQPVRLPAPHVQKTQQCVSWEVLLSVRLCGRGQQREAQHAGEFLLRLFQVIMSEFTTREPDQQGFYIHRVTPAPAAPSPSRTWGGPTAPRRSTSRPTWA